MRPVHQLMFCFPISFRTQVSFSWSIQSHIFQPFGGFWWFLLLNMPIEGHIYCSWARGGCDGTWEIMLGSKWLWLQCESVIRNTEVWLHTNIKKWGYRLIKMLWSKACKNSVFLQAQQFSIHEFSSCNFIEHNYCKYSTANTWVVPKNGVFSCPIFPLLTARCSFLPLLCSQGRCPPAGSAHYSK